MRILDSLKSLVIRTVTINVRFDCCCVHRRGSAVRMDFEAGPITEQDFPVPEAGISMPQVLTDSQQVSFSLVPKNKRGNEAPIDGVAQWTNSNPAAASLEVSEDGKSAVVKALTPGETTISAVADADLGEGLREIVAQDTVSVKAGEAVTLGFVAGPITEQA